MSKTMVIAARDYLAAVKSKGFIIGIILMPVMMFGSVIVSRLTKDIVDITDKRLAVIDRTPRAEVFGQLTRKNEERNEKTVRDPETGKQRKAKIVLERIDPAALDDAAAVEQQRFELSERVRNNELFAFVEIGHNVLAPIKLGATTMPTTKAVETARRQSDSFDIDARLEAAATMLGEDNIVRYYSNRPTYRDVQSFVQEVVGQFVMTRRAFAAGMEEEVISAIAKPPLVAQGSLYERAASGQIKQEVKQGAFTSIFMPLGMLLLMFVVVIIGSSQLATNVVEEKQLRIAEVLLGSVRPFDLMLGKLIGGVGVALTLAAVYIIGAYLGAREWGIAKYLTPMTIAVFCMFVVMATFMYGGMFVAAGAAVTNLKEAQSLITPIMLIVMLPMFFFGQMINDPSGAIARFLTFFPFSAPMVTVMRLGIPPGLQPWEVAAAAGVTLLTTLAIVWAAGRVFRVGILMQGQPAKLGQVMKWVVSG